MKSVWVLWCDNDTDDADLLGIFDSEDKAIQAGTLCDYPEYSRVEDFPLNVYWTSFSRGRTRKEIS